MTFPDWLQPDTYGPMVVVGIGLAAAVIWGIGWVPDAKAHPIRARLRQALVLALVSILTLCLVGLGLNRANLWYPTWQSMWSTPVIEEELHAGEATEPAQSEGWVTKPATDLQAHPETNPAFAGYTWTNGADGDYVFTKIPGSGVGDKTTDVMVWFPPSYRTHPDRFYPVIVAFPGVPGNPTSYRKSLNIGKVVREASEAKTMREAVVVSPDVFTRNIDTECLDSADGSIKMDTFITVTLRQWILTNLRVVDSPQAWAGLGYSAGGWCAAMVAVKHADQYGLGVNMSGYFWPTYLGKKLRPEKDPAYYLPDIAKKTAPNSRILFLSAKDDKEPVSHWKKFSESLRPPTSMSTIFMGNGGHAWPVWVAGIPKVMSWLGESSSEFAWNQP